MSCLSHLRAWCARRWESTQVELHGQYSIAHLQDFEQYHAHTGWLRVTLVCLLTPVPVVLYVLFVDSLPLEPPEWGTRRSIRVWGRTCFTAFQNSACILEQMYQHIPLLAVPRWTTAFVAMLAAVCAVGTVFVLSLFIGYPLPFTMVIGTIPWALITFGVSFLLKRRQFRDHPELLSSVSLYLVVTMCQLSMIFIYPIYNFFYKSLSSWDQTAFVLLLPVIKVAAKNWICRALPDSDDVKPEAVVFNVEIFHALFVSLCMGNTSSSRTVAALMAVDLVQAWLSFHDMMSIVQGLQPLFGKIKKPTRDAPPHRRMPSLVDLSHQVLQLDPRRDPIQHKAEDCNGRERKLRLWPRSIFATSQVSPVQTASSAVATSIVPLPGPTEKHKMPTEIGVLSEEERDRLVKQTQKLLFATEFIVLIEYVEVMMPAMYSIYLAALFCLPNRAFYPFLEGIHTFSELKPKIANILLYASCEFVSFVLMAVIVWWKLRFSLAHQLAFVLERRAANIQAKLLLWVVYIMQNAILQLGADYSLRFVWLNHRGPDDRPPPPP